MTDVDDIINYIKSLKKGFDKDLFLSKVDELAYIVENEGLEYDDFHTLFKVWLNLSIPITKWVSLGACLVPKEKVEERTVEYSLRWLLANYENQISFSRIGFLLDWLTAAMDCDSIDMIALDYGYEVYYTMLTYEVLTAHTMKLVYNLTKPVDVTRRRVLELLDYSKKREAKKSLYRQLQVLLGLFKSYKPECVPEDVPSISIHTSFRKINTNLLNRFKLCQMNRNNSNHKKHHLLWTNPINYESGRSKKADPLVPNMEFLNIASKQYIKQSLQKNYLDFSDPVSLLEYSVRRVPRRPARLRALLCNESGMTLLALASRSEHAFLSHDLHHMLTNCFLNISPHSYSEKQDLLQRLATFQRTILQGVPVITRFLAQFLPFWNEKDFFAEIMDLVTWISVDCIDHINSILDTFKKIFCRAQPIEQCAILKSLSEMYTNLVYSSTRKKNYFMNMESSHIEYSQILRNVAAHIMDMTNKALQINPGDMCTLFSGSSAAERCARAELRHGRAAVSVPKALLLALSLLSTSAALVENVATMLVLYRKIVMMMKKTAGSKALEADDSQLRTLKAFTSDMTSSLYNEECLSSRKEGLVFNRLHPQIASRLVKSVPNADAMLSLRNHLAFAPYTYVQLEELGEMGAENGANSLWFSAAIDRQFTGLADFLVKAVPQLRVDLYSRSHS